MFVYSLVRQKVVKSDVHSTIYELDMLKLLDGQEVLGFGLDDIVGEHFSVIAV